MKKNKHAKKWIWEGLGLNLAGVWGALGRLLATFGRIVLAFWAFKAISFKALVQDELQKAFWIDFGRIWNGFGEDFDRIWVGSWEDSASFLEGLWKDLEKILQKIVDGVRPFFRVFSQLGHPRCFEHSQNFDHPFTPRE